MDPRKQRIQELTKYIEYDYALLKKVEARFRREDDPIRQDGLEHDMNTIRNRINQYNAELKSLIIEFNTYPLASVEEEVEDTSNKDGTLDAPVDLLASAFQYRTEMLKKQSELSDISNWFNAGNEPGSDQCDYAATFLQSIRQIIQPFSKLIDEATSTEPRADIVQFRPSLMHPLHLCLNRLDNLLAHLIPDFKKSYAQSREHMTRQEAISKALHDLNESVREVNVHLALYKALLVYDLPKLNSLCSKLDVPYKVMIADSREMKVSQLIEYCKRINNYYEKLKLEVL